jgi:cephalosporin-C deacetylase
MEARRFPLDPIYASFETGLKSVEVFDVTFNGFGGHPIKAWLLLPRQREGKLPCIVEYIGYGGRGNPVQWLTWGSFGYAHLIMDNRGQGRNWELRGYTPDPTAGNVQPHFPDYLIRRLKRESEGRTDTWFTFDGDITAVQVNKVARDGQTQSRAAGAPR